MRVDQHPSSPDHRTSWVRWRERRLVTAGFEPGLAGTLAREQRVDLHAVLELIDRGCTPRLAARILAPLDQPLDGSPEPLDRPQERP
jgi:hypothetical protein